jgi:hypothetical protein
VVKVQVHHWKQLERCQRLLYPVSKLSGFCLILESLLLSPYDIVICYHWIYNPWYYSNGFMGVIRQILRKKKKILFVFKGYICLHCATAMYFLIHFPWPCNILWCQRLLYPVSKLSGFCLILESLLLSPYDIVICYHNILQGQGKWIRKYMAASDILIVFHLNLWHTAAE